MNVPGFSSGYADVVLSCGVDWRSSTLAMTSGSMTLVGSPEKVMPAGPPEPLTDAELFNLVCQ